jgi:ADP-dependent NAD(P)H-hydrate dehydratase
VTVRAAAKVSNPKEKPMSEGKMETVTELPKLAPRRSDGHKGNYGRVLVIAGSRGMSGAAVLSGSAALRAGAGLVKVAAPHEILPIIAVSQPCYTTAALPQDADGRISFVALDTLFELAKEHDVVAIGPGLGRSAELTRLLSEVVATLDRPLVVDADGLNAFVSAPEKVKGLNAPRIVTPHPGEFARLLGVDTKAVQADRLGLAISFAKTHQVVVVLKGEGTIVTDGARVFVNRTGNPGMATGGTGDVLTGILAALVGQGLAPFEAAQLAVHVHGAAGDLARDHLGEISLIAQDLLDFLPTAFRAL